jgi:hypothetical protein
LYEFPTYTGLYSGDDLETDADAGYLTGHRSLPEDARKALRSGNMAHIRSMLDRLEAGDEVYFIKTHSTWTELRRPAYRTILLVRDGRDALISLAWYSTTVANTFWRLRGTARRDFTWELKCLLRLARHAFAAIKYATLRLIGLKRKLFRRALRSALEDTRWSTFNKDWLARNDGKLVLVRFEDLIMDPRETLASALEELNMPRLRSTCQSVPEFNVLKSIHPQFFRQGKSGGWRREFPVEWLDPFWTIHGEMMLRLGYGKDG